MTELNNANGSTAPMLQQGTGRLAFALFVVLAIVVGGAASGSPAAAAKNVPKFSNHLVDDANVVPDDVEQQVNNELADYQTRTTNQVAVLTVKTTEPQSIEDYAVDVGNEWGIGNKDKDNGILMVLAMDDRKGRIEVGYGVQGDLTDVKARDILETQVFPRLKQGNPGEAVVSGERAIRASLGDTNVEAPVPLQRTGGGDEKNNRFWWLPWVFILAPIVLGAFGAGRRRRNGFGSGGWAYWGGMGGLGGGGFGGGGLGGGGFSGGGGGSFGGGGSSGSW